MKPLFMGGPPIRIAEGPGGGGATGPRGAEGAEGAEGADKAGPPIGRGPFMFIRAA